MVSFGGEGWLWSRLGIYGKTGSEEEKWGTDPGGAMFLCETDALLLGVVFSFLEDTTFLIMETGLLVLPELFASS